MPFGNGLGPGALALVLSGTSSALLSKLLYQLEGPGRDGTVHAFEKPWASTLLMFLGMAACLPATAAVRAAGAWLASLDSSGGGHTNNSGNSRGAGGAGGGGGRGGLTERLLAQHQAQRRPPLPPRPALERYSMGTQASLDSTATNATVGAWGAAGPDDGGDGGTPGGGASRRRARLLVLVPTLIDLVATILLSVGLLYTTASVFSMVRGSEIVFSALLSTAFLRRPLNRWHLAGIVVCTAGITLVGTASFMESGAGSSPSLTAAAPKVTGAELALGIGMVLAAEAVQSAQVVVEDLFLHSMDLEPVAVVGWEGVYGLALMCVILPTIQRLPGTEGDGVHEDSLDTLAMLRGAPDVRAAAAWFTLGVAAYNVAGMLVTDSLGAVTRTVLETLKTLLVWVLNLLAFYASDRSLGEPWTPHSWLQALGFAVLVGGTLVYARGEEVQARRLRAKLRWARLRASLAELVPARRAARPLPPPRMAGAGVPRIRAASIPPVAVWQAVQRLDELAEDNRSVSRSMQAGTAGAVLGAGATAAARPLGPAPPVAVAPGRTASAGTAGLAQSWPGPYRFAARQSSDTEP